MNPELLNCYLDPRFRSTLRIPPDDQDDALHDVFIKHLESPQSTVHDPPAFLRTAAQNCYKDRCKAESRRTRRERRGTRIEVSRSAGPTEVIGSTHRLRSSVPAGHTPPLDPSHRLLHREMRHQMIQAARIAGLSAKQRCALYAWARDRLDKFAKRHSLRMATVRVWVSRARRSIKPHLLKVGLGRDHG